MEKDKSNVKKVAKMFDTVTISDIKVPLACRPNTSDRWLIGTIFEKEEYKLPIENFKPKLILDCGANVGYSAVYFATMYPEAKIISVEPEKSNFQMLQYNTHFFNNVQCINSALWNKETYIKVLPDNPGHTAAFRTVETTEDDANALKTTTVDKLLSDSGFEKIDLLKMDIEGAEKEVFSANQNVGGGY